MSLASSSVIEKIQMRAKALSSVRQFFQKRDVFEVDTPIYNPFPNIDANVEPVALEKGYLRTSPEFIMKQMLSVGACDIYEIAHVFRKGELGAKHNPEFTLIEWYRKGFNLNQMIQETLELIGLFVDTSEVTFWTYQELFQTFLQIDPLHCTIASLQQKLPQSAPKLSSKDEILDFLLTHQVEPHLQQNIHVVLDYPASQCALAKIENAIAKRFEIYVHGLEIANGYDELCDSKEQQKRFEKENLKRHEQNQPLFPIDKKFIECLDHLPPCCGVAVGLDRLLMIQHQKTKIEHVLL